MKGLSFVEVLIRHFFPSRIVKLLQTLKVNLRILAAKFKIKRSEPLKKKRAKIGFGASLVEHCNLNCKGCSNFSCIAEPDFVDPENFRHDMERMGEIFGHVCDGISLIGGEPLLHTEIVSLMKTSRKNFTEGIIYVFTNGILLPSMSPDFWEACRENDIGIKISAYPIKLDIAKITEMAQKYSVNVSWVRDATETERSTFRKQRINLAGNSDIALNFAVCARGNGCITLSKGRLYTCTFAAHIHNFSRCFGQNIELTDADSLNIYDDMTADEILQELTKPIPLCRYCDTISPPETFTWGPTKRDIKEWV